MVRISRQEHNRLIARSYVQYYEELRRLGEKQGLSWDLAADQVQDFYVHWLEMPVTSNSQPQKKNDKPWAKRGVWLAGLTHHRRQAARKAAEASYAARRQAAEQRKSAERRTLLDEMVEQQEWQKNERATGLDKAIRRILKEHATDRMRLIYEMRLRGRKLVQIADALTVSERTVRSDMKNVRDILQAELPLLGWSLP
jgi:DNA-directed RNA polymerase specialized sigma24 family protein